MRGVEHFKPGDAFADKYEMRELIGRGGMGVVYRAWHRYLDKDVALKLVPLVARNASVDMKERFRKETAAMGRLKHANIVEVFDGGVVGDTAYIAMELMTGWNLRQLLLKGRLRHLQICLFLAQVSDALFCLHQNKILHRDIKPENLFVTMDLRVKVIDFGLARVRTASKYATQNPIPAGTPQYMAPEQLLNAPLDESVDVYALGMVAWEATTGKHPIAVATGMVADRDEWIHRMMSGVPLPDLAEQGCEAPPALVGLVMRCLSFDAAKRPTAAEISTELRRLARELAEQPPSRDVKEPLSIEERLAMLPPSTARLDAATIVDAVSSEEASTVERIDVWRAPVDAPTTPDGRGETLALAGPARGLHLEIVASDVGPVETSAPPATPVMAPHPATLAPATPVMIEGAQPRAMPSTLQSNASLSELGARQDTARAGRHPQTSVSPGTPQLGTPARSTEMLPHGFRPPEAHPPAGHPPAAHPPQAFAGARPTVPMSPQPARTTLRDGTPSAHAPRAPAPRERPSRDEPAFTPGPVTGPRIEARPTFQRARGLAFVAGLLVIGGVAAGSFVVRLRAAHAATCTKGIVAFGNTAREGSRTVAEMGDAPSMPVAAGTQDVVTTQRASPSSNAIPSAPAQGAAPSTRLPIATPTAQPVAPKGTAPARPAPAASASSEIFDTWK